MSPPDFDVIVVGAGAAGAASAFFLRQAGLRVLVLEREELPRYKACGGAVPRCTLDRFPFPFGDVIRGAPARVRFTFPGLSPVDLALPERPVVMVVRSEFDAYVLARADAEVMENAKVVGVSESQDRVEVTIASREPPHRKLSARYLIGADGATSRVAHSLGLRAQRQLGGTLEAEVPLLPGSDLAAKYGEQAVFCLGAQPYGYAWVFPKGDLLSVGIGRFGGGRSDLRGNLHRAMQTMGIDISGVRLNGHPLPIHQSPPWPFWTNRPVERLSTSRSLLVGDAAGLVDPLIGEGIRYAIQSAGLAAEAIAQDDVSRYDTVIWDEIGHSLAIAGLTARLFYRWPRQCFELGLRNPKTLAHFLDLMTGRASYRGIGRRIVAATAVWLAGGGQDATHRGPRVLRSAEPHHSGKEGGQ